MLGEGVVLVVLVTSSALGVITIIVDGGYHSLDILIEGGDYGCHRGAHANLGWIRVQVYGAQEGGVGVCPYPYGHHIRLGLAIGISTFATSLA